MNNAIFQFTGMIVRQREETMDDGTKFAVFSQMIAPPAGKPYIHDYWVKGTPQNEQILGELEDCVGRDAVVSGSMKPHNNSSAYKLSAIRCLSAEEHRAAAA